MKEIIDFENDKEFRKIILNQAYDYLSEGASYRKVAPKYGISHVSLRYRFLKYLEKVDPVIAQLVFEKSDKKKKKSIDDSEVRERVSKAFTLMLVEDLTINQIAEKLESTPFTIYRDLLVRLPKLKEISEKDYQKLKEKLAEHSINNLNNVGKNNEGKSL